MADLEWKEAILKRYSLSAKAVVLDPAGRCLLLRRAAQSRNHAGLWEFPGGKLEPGEQPDEALVRELREETGLHVMVHRVAGAGESELPDRKVAYLFFEAFAPTGAVALSGEHDAYQWVPPGQLPLMDLCPQFRPFAREYAALAMEPDLAR